MTPMTPMMEPADVNDTWEHSPLASIRERISAPQSLSEGPVKFLLVSGQLDDNRWGLVGAFWVSIDGARGGFIVAPDGIWAGSEMVRSYKGALERGWDAEKVYSYWQGQVGMAGRFMIDPQQHADTLFQVARRVGAL